MNSEAEAAESRTAPAPRVPAARRRWPWWAGLFAGLLLAALAGMPLLYFAYRKGKERGREAERERFFQIEQPFIEPDREWPRATRRAPASPTGKPEPARADAGGPEPARAVSTTAPKEAGAPAATPQTWCFTANECVRAVWPMEVLSKSSTVDHPHFRVREGANRLTGLDNGLCEFVFRTEYETGVAISFHVRYSDDCGNSLRFYMDGGQALPLGGTKEFGRWIWERSLHRFRLEPGLHRLTFQTREDGLEFDRVVVAEQPLTGGGLWLSPTAPAFPFSLSAVPQPALAELEALAATPAPVFESMPPAASNLPAIGAVTSQMFASDSLVIGAGHRNTLTVFLRLNGPEAVSGQVELQSSYAGYSEQREFTLTPAERTRLLSWEITLRPRFGYFVPVRMRVVLPSGCVHQQTLNFIRPLEWAFLGPIPDPEGKGLDFVPAPEHLVESFSARPPFPGLAWKVVEDGSCYNEFGVVDLNKVFGRPNEGWHEGVENHPEVAYAVTGLLFGSENRHLPLVVAGDDCVQAWLNGQPWVRQFGNGPLETSRMVIGTGVRPGVNTFVFKIPQTCCYWQLLFEPENTLPYSYPHAFQSLPSRVLKQFSGPRIRFAP